MPKAAVKEKPKKIVPGSKAELMERFKDYPGLTAWERAYENPAGPGSLPILLIDEAPNACTHSGHQTALPLGATKCPCGLPARKYYLRHVNTKQPGRVAAVQSRGLIPVEYKELLAPNEISDIVKDAADGLVHTGINGAKVLYKIPLDLYNQRKRRERDIRTRRNSNPVKVREDIANDASSVLGSEAADAIHSGLQYSEREIRTTLQDEASGMGADDE